MIVAAKVLQGTPKHPNGLALQRADGTAEGVQHPDFELLTGRLREVVIGRPYNECSQSLSMCHVCLPLVLKLFFSSFSRSLEGQYASRQPYAYGCQRRLCLPPGRGNRRPSVWPATR